MTKKRVIQRWPTVMLTDLAQPVEAGARSEDHDEH
jgi:hypothetical protein